MTKYNDALGVLIPQSRHPSQLIRPKPMHMAGCHVIYPAYPHYHLQRLDGSANQGRPASRTSTLAQGSSTLLHLLVAPLRIKGVIRAR